MEQGRPRALDSLEWKLPLLIGGLVVVIVAAAMLVTQHELRQSAREMAYDRLERTATDIGALVTTAVRTRASNAVAALAEPDLAAVLTGGAADPEAVDEVLDRLRTPADSGYAIELHDLRRTVLHRSGSRAWHESDAAGTASTAEPADTVSYSPFFVAGDEAAYWVSIPVWRGPTIVGHVHQMRPAGNRTVGGQVEQLLGGVEVLFSNAEGGPWVGLDGDVSVVDGRVESTGEPFRRGRSSGSDAYAFAVPLEGTPWLIIAEVPVDEIMAGPRGGVRRLLLLGAILLMAGGVAAWLVSRSVTQPLGRLGAAADAIAGGDYGRRTGLTRTDEIGSLARSFDQMVAHVDATHRQLRDRYRESQALTAQLESANSRLQRVVTELERAQLEAQQASRAKSEFLATMSHEIRTPINAVIGYADLMDAGISGQLSPQQKDYVDRIRRSSEHLVAVVNDVLDFAKIESGQMRVLREERSVSVTIDAAVAMLQAKAATRGIDLSVRCPADMVFLGDAQRVQQILLNLLSNALKFTERGGRVAVVCEQRQSRAVAENGAATQSWTCITVSDTGPGIDHGQQEQVFEPFVQGSAGYTRRHGGTGLGLAISRSLARMMGGDLTLESVPGRGASFTVWIPHPATEGAIAGGG
jgi:signal transduction histidine kinase